jgi:hypothetical protein
MRTTSIKPRKLKALEQQTGSITCHNPMHGGNKQDKPTLYNPMILEQQTAPFTHQQSKT